MLHSIEFAGGKQFIKILAESVTKKLDHNTLLRLATQCRDSELEVLIAMTRTLLNTYGSKYFPENTHNPETLS